MPDFGYHGFRRGWHRHHHHRPEWLNDQLDMDAIASAMDPLADMGCDPLSPGFRAFGQDDSTDDPTSDDGSPPDDGSGGQGGVLDAVNQVAQGVGDVIASAAPPVDYAPPPVYVLPPRHHRHHHHPHYFAPPPPVRAPFSRWELERIERERLRRLAMDQRRRRFWGEDEGESEFGAFINPLSTQFSLPINPNPAYRFGPNGYRPRGPRHYGHGYGHPHHGMFHPHHHHHRGMGPMGPPPMDQGPQPLPPGSYQQSCSGCTYDGQMLSCQCNDTSGNPQQTSIATDPSGMGGLSNHNGVLVHAAS